MVKEQKCIITWKDAIYFMEQTSVLEGIAFGFMFSFLSVQTEEVVAAP
jgi:hypothetical protein